MRLLVSDEGINNRTVGTRHSCRNLISKVTPHHLPTKAHGYFTIRGLPWDQILDAAMLGDHIAIARAFAAIATECCGSHARRQVREVHHQPSPLRISSTLLRLSRRLRFLTRAGRRSIPNSIHSSGNAMYGECSFSFPFSLLRIEVLRSYIDEVPRYV